MVVLRYQIWPKNEGARNGAEDIEAAARRMQREMERSADEIIARMGDHIEHLEQLVEEADARAKRLERRLEELRDMTSSLPQPSSYDDGFEHLLKSSMAAENSVRQLEPPAPAREHLKQERLTVNDWEDAAALIVEEGPDVVVAPSVADVVDLPLTPEEEAWAAEENSATETVSPGRSASEADDSGKYSAIDSPGEEYASFPAVTETAHELSEASPQEAALGDAEENSSAMFITPEPTSDLAASAGEYPEDTRTPKEETNIPVSSQIIAENATGVSSEPSDETSADESKELFAATPGDTDSTTGKVRAMLAKGQTASEVARELHLGRGAVELILQMEKNQKEGQ